MARRTSLSVSAIRFYSAPPAVGPGISHSTATRYSAVAEHLLADELDQAPQQ
ncbi:hypothetical protein ACTMTI_50620 [Nonomuraea sp. H19]|uniref:hypothetical protein n=1 Tax=Nonomuraea sp. H19 TaxID=3452206 RepID=UPI003F8BA37E